MNPTAPANPEMHLPAPVAESSSVPIAAPGEASAPEVAPRQATNAPISLPLPPISGTNPVVSQTSSNGAIPTTNIAVPLTADDNDLIEKEWVNKAKLIVERTKSDPSQQSKEIGVFKADYLQKRYNKTIKLSE